MNPNNIDQLRVAAEAGDIDQLYEVIQNDPSVFENIDSKQFVETPLHIAASRGHLPFATEIMNLKPSFALKLNQQGYSPIHLAIQNNQKRMVFLFVNLNRELVRVKGREGWTPIHFASQMGDIELLAKFLFACPESIENMTVRGQTALHIAIKNGKYEALHLLVCFLRKSTARDALKLEYKILNWNDEDGNTILHISGLSNNLQIAQEMQLLVKRMIYLNTKNFENETALDIATTQEIKKILISAGAKLGSEVTDSQTREDKIKSKSTILYKIAISINRIRDDILEEQRNTWLIIATLVATATYQSILSPTGGVYQANASDNNFNITSSNSTISSALGNAGKSILSNYNFVWFAYLNTLSFGLSTILILILSPPGIFGLLVFEQVCLFGASYIYSMMLLSPFKYFVAWFVGVLILLIVLIASSLLIFFKQRDWFVYILKWS